jgi:hypothetical protein
MDKMRAVVEELIQEDEARKAAKKAGAKAMQADSGVAIQDGSEIPSPMAGMQRRGSPSPKRGAKSGKASPMAQKVQAGLGLGSSPKSARGAAVESPHASNALLPDDFEGEEVSSPTAKQEKASPAFTAQGTESAVFDEASRVNLKRFFFKGRRAGEPTPEVGHYRVQENLVMKRVPLAMDFGYRAPHGTRKVAEDLDKSRELGPEDLTKLDIRWATSGSMSPSPAMFSTLSPSTSKSERSLSSSWPEGLCSKSVMSTSTKRPDLTKIPGARLCLGMHRTITEVSEPNKPEEQDYNTSGIKRIKQVDMAQYLSRKGEMGKECQFFEAGKYAVKFDVVSPSVKVHTGFHQQLSRATTTGKLAPKGMHHDKGSKHVQDRSLYRHQACRPRITHVMHMHKDLDRPPLTKPPPILHDESDPEVVAKVREREMTFDATTVDRAVTHRNDHAPSMHRSIARDKASLGSRHAQDDGAIRRLHSASNYNPERHGEERSPAELKTLDSLRRRPDIGLMTFEQSKARDKTRLAGEYSSLHRPRHHAAPEFSRSAPHIGFTTSAPFKAVQRNRQHDAIEGWSPEAVDDLMSKEDD